MSIQRPIATGALTLLLFACSKGSDSTQAAQTPCAAGSVVTLDSLQAVTLPASSANCFEMQPGTGAYIIVPQFATTAPDTAPVSYEIGALSAASADVANGTAVFPDRIAGGVVPLLRSTGSFASGFDHGRRARARALAAALAVDPGARLRISAALAGAPAVAPPAVGSSRIFQVCGTIQCGSFKRDTAILKFVGTNVLLYQSQDAPASPNGFTDAQIAGFGSVFDQTLYPIDVNAFGPPTDVDNNGRVIVLLSPKVNALTPSATCQSQGYIAGFFYSGDLIPGAPGSNFGEIYYGIAPDPLGTFSCTHTVADVEDGAGATFLHETLHMINFGEKVLIHGLNDTEAEFLDEGMAKIAEELGSKHYEALYPPPTGRSNPAQLFPDSAEGFISGDLVNSYFFMSAPNASTEAITIPNGSNLADAGGEWLFLRWLGDQRGEAIYGQIVGSALVGQANLEAQAGEPFGSLFGKASLALYTDSLVGVPRNAVPASYSYSTRNLRRIEHALFVAVGGPTAQFPFEFPIQLKPLTAGTKVGGAMTKGTMDFYRYSAPAAGAAERLHFAGSGGAAFASALGAQVTVFRCPTTAGACQ